MGSGESKSAPAPAPAPSVVKIDFTMQIREKFANVKVDSSKLRIAEKALGKIPVSNYESGLANDNYRGVKTGENALKTFGNLLVGKLGLKLQDNINKILKAVNIAGSVDEYDVKMEEFKMSESEPGKGDKQFTSMYGFLVGSRQRYNDKVDFNVTVSRIAFSVNPNKVFDTEEVEAIKNHYSKMKALEALKQENVIEKIVYIN